VQYGRGRLCTVFNVAPEGNGCRNGRIQLGFPRAYMRLRTFLEDYMEDYSGFCPHADQDPGGI
jgi:hypothetical protein